MTDSSSSWSAPPAAPVDTASEPRYLSARRIAEALDVSPQWVYRHGANLPHVQLPTGRKRWKLEVFAQLKDADSIPVGRPRGSGRGTVGQHQNAWQARIMVHEIVDGVETSRRVTKRFPLDKKAEAYKWLGRVLSQGLDEEPRKKELTIGQLIQKFLDHHGLRWRPATLTGARSHLTGKTTWPGQNSTREVTAVTRRDLQEWINEAAKRLKSSTIRAWMQRFRSLWRWAIREKLVPATGNPTEGLDFPIERRQGKRRRVLTYQEAARLIQHGTGVYRLAWALALLGGFRRKEMRDTTWADVDLERKHMVVDGKLGRDELPICSWLADELAAAGRRKGPLVPRCGGRIHQALAEDLAKAKIDPTGLSPHRLRATFASLLDDLGASRGVKRFLMRHQSSAEQTDTYVVAYWDRAHAVLEKLVQAIRDAGAITSIANQ